MAHNDLYFNESEMDCFKGRFFSELFSGYGIDLQKSEYIFNAASIENGPRHCKALVCSGGKVFFLEFDLQGSTYPEEGMYVAWVMRAEEMHNLNIQDRKIRSGSGETAWALHIEFMNSENRKFELDGYVFEKSQKNMILQFISKV